MDISIILETDCPSIQKCIDYCKARNVNCEIVDNQYLAKGKYTCIISEEIYFHEYYLHVCWVALNHKNIQANRVIIPAITVYDQINNEFYMGSFTNKFFRTKKGFRSPDIVEDKIIMGCQIQPTVELERDCPEDAVLLDYYRYFTGKNKAIFK